MARFSSRWTGIKLGLVYSGLIAELVAILWFGWAEAMKAATLGGGDYAPGTLATVFLASILIGIPALLVLTLTYLALRAVAFDTDEIEDHEARKLLARMPPSPQPERESGASSSRNYDE